MGFEQDPDYELLRGLFKNVMNSHGLISDNEFDWTSKLYGTSSSCLVNFIFIFLEY
jgi:hypothetical protein